MDATQATVTRFRHHPARAVAGLIVTISTVTLAGFSPYYAMLVMVPAAYTIWVWRAGTDADQAGLRVRALLGQRRLPWSAVAGLACDDQGRVMATLASGSALSLTAVTTVDLPQLVAASGHKLADQDGHELTDRETPSRTRAAEGR